MNPAHSLKTIRNNQGFTLFEALAAAMVLAIALTVIMQLFSGGLRAGHLADQYARAVWHAQEKIDEILMLTRIDATALSGGWEDGFSWQAILIDQTPPGQAVEADPLRAFAVTVQVQWVEEGKQREVTLESVALARLAVEPS